MTKEESKFISDNIKRIKDKVYSLEAFMLLRRDEFFDYREFIDVGWEYKGTSEFLKSSTAYDMVSNAAQDEIAIFCDLAEKIDNFYNREFVKACGVKI